MQKRSRTLVAGVLLLAVTPAFAQAGGSPWENAVNALKTSFTGPIATGLSLVAIVVGGLTFAYGEGHSKEALAGIIFGVGMAIGAVNFMSWLVAAQWATKYDPQILRVLLNSSKFKAFHDPASREQ